MKPFLLLTNDDGIDSPALTNLVEVLQEEYQLAIVAPKYPQSAKGCSHAHGDSWVSIENKVINGIKWVSVDNSPATCVSVALRYLKLKPDLVISGINHGENLGLNLFYSGTIGAAWESAMSGYLSLAVSLVLPPNMHYTMDEEVDFSISAQITKSLVKKFLADKPSCLLWNVNIPTNATKETEIKETKTGNNRWNYPVIRETRESDNVQQVRFEYDPTGFDFDDDTDVSIVRAGYVSLVKIDHFTLPWGAK